MSPITPSVYSLQHITAEAAELASKTALRLADEMGIVISVAVVDNGGHLVHFARHDAAQFLTIDVAINKAWTASSFALPSHDWNEIVQQPSLAPLSQTPRFTPVAGGCPLYYQDGIIGAIGISGGSPQQDHYLADCTVQQLDLGG
ncbi:GlcG/HbpS family heme-binding protein [Rahnella variigena]|uniref:GlcG/HbpS family heme-binding protein n=1 Tax=Rahnella variigena TaxID=574964 RepID=UPI00132FC6DD|nr:heme-binding protein [Rahnella variigena]